MFCVDEAGSTVREDRGRVPWVAGPRGSSVTVCVDGMGSSTMPASLVCSSSCVVEFHVRARVQLSFLYDLPNSCSASSLCSVSSSSAQRTRREGPRVVDSSPLGWTGLVKIWVEIGREIVDLVV